ncbi:hypothetical protein LDENG_00271440 [Lucifuga dentata]|nr:hypothetical protein LDENG_00271440 [Lucifuga dentata]
MLIHHFSPDVAVTCKVCEPPDKPLNGDFLPVYGPKQELLSVNYLCHPPFTLMGAQQRTCLPDATWSGTAPTCIKVQTSSAWCVPPPKLLNSYYKPAAARVEGAEMIEFFCKNSYILSGNHQSTCLSNGSWSSSPPKCVRACREPKVSELVRQRVVKPHLISRESPDQRLLLSSRYKLYDMLAPGFFPLPLDKQPDRDGASSYELPRGFHPVYTSIEYKCASSLYRRKGSARRTCLKSGRWSGHHVSCSPVCGQFAAFSTHTLTGTQWPWHAAIYIRSPDHSISTQRSHVITTSGQWRASEESTSWYLACSGALVSQWSVVVAAHCVVEKETQQLLHPAHVKVVVCMNNQKSREWMKSQQHLRVSAVLVHPNFYSALDSDVAVLKLTDKAKISERVLLACLPRMQGGEVTVQEAYTARWMLASDHKHPSLYMHSSQTKHVELVDISQCEREFGHSAMISDNALCVIRKPSVPDSLCHDVIPGITVVPVVFSSTSSGLSAPEETQGASSISWQLLGLESFGYDQRNCHRQTYIGQTRIANFRDWIEENMK